MSDRGQSHCIISSFFTIRRFVRHHQSGIKLATNLNKSRAFSAKGAWLYILWENFFLALFSSRKLECIKKQKLLKHSRRLSGGIIDTAESRKVRKKPNILQFCVLKKRHLKQTLCGWISPCERALRRERARESTEDLLRELIETGKVCNIIPMILNTVANDSIAILAKLWNSNRSLVRFRDQSVPRFRTKSGC